MIDWSTVGWSVFTSVCSSGVVAALISNRATYRSIAVGAITKERITWLDELRKITEDFSAELLRIHNAAEPVNENKGEADRLFARLQLQLNPDVSERRASSKRRKS